MLIISGNKHSFHLSPCCIPVSWPFNSHFSEEPTNLDVPTNEKPSAVVRSLAKALLQVEQMLEYRYLMPPLGEFTRHNSEIRVFYLKMPCFDGC